jgi:hypothetical protein
MDRKMRVEVTLSAKEAERLRLLADELATTPSEALRQLAAHGRQGWPWLLWLDLRHQLRTLLMQRLRPRSKRIGFKLPRRSDGASRGPRSPEPMARRLHAVQRRIQSCVIRNGSRV